eukprot:6919771-Pyramimonas_sp.AAC.1
MAAIPGWQKSVKEEWAASFQGIAGELDISQDESFIKRHREDETVHGLIDAWNSDDQMRLASSTKDEKRNTEFKLIEGFVIGLVPAAR